MNKRFADNPAYVEYESLLIELHSLIAQGKCDSDEADELRDRMDKPWYQLDREERARLDGLSADLYMLADDEILEPNIPHYKDQQVLFREIKTLQREKDWDAVLAALRRRPSTVPSSTVAFSRARAYDALGHDKPALLFLNYAHSKGPNRDLVILKLPLLLRSGRKSEAHELAKEIITDPESSPSQLIFAADALVESCATDQLACAHGALDALERGLSSVSVQQPTPREHIILAFVIASGCLLRLGRRKEAIASLNEAKRLDPKDKELDAVIEAVGTQERSTLDELSAPIRARLRIEGERVLTSAPSLSGRAA